MLYLGADHAGYNLKQEIKKELKELGIEYNDLGNKEFEPKDDYPDFALEVSKKVFENNNNKGILFCATGIGMCITANKIKGIRATICCNEFMAKQAVEHNNVNILCLGGKVLDLETAKKIIKIWLKTEFTGEERHIRRLEKIKNIEK
ncbi:ribose 5-phosphate isomerase B [Patescibacteria group bacterium]